MFDRIPLPNPNNYKMFDDVFDYLEQIRKRKAASASDAAKLAEDQRQFGVTSKLDRDKLAELTKYHQGELAKDADLKPLRLELLKAQIEKAQHKGNELSPQERTQKMKLLESGRTSIGVIRKTDELEKILTENPHLTGVIPFIKNKFGHGGETLGNFTSQAAELQAMIAKLGGQRGGAQLVKWAEKMKPNEWKDVASNLGNVRGTREASKHDLADIADEYETITGEKFPLNASVTPQTDNEYSEEDIQHTMKVNKMTREQVLDALNKKGAK